MTTKLFEVAGPTFTQADADRIERSLQQGARAEVTIDGIRFPGLCEVGTFVLIDEVARPEGRPWKVAVYS